MHVCFQYAPTHKFLLLLSICIKDSLMQQPL
uniref:Uncharacterized protein n=1 Tax=Rhizophora mucronata TaxID=61149 RepID=A0A2P2IVZ4_RHIMU